MKERICGMRTLEGTCLWNEKSEQSAHFIVYK
jgi:hypothetical protein